VFYRILEKLMKNPFEEPKLYIKVAKNRFEIQKISGERTSETVSAPEPFSTSRLLVGNMSLAERYLAEGIKKVLPAKLIKRHPAVLIHPIEMTEGGLSEVETKVLHELAAAAGARKVVVWEGDELTPEEAAQKLDSA
jgi:actin-like ATPase involved in cell morphogenesis